MNDRHPSGNAQYAAYDGYSTTSFAADPLFGDLSGNDPYDTGSYDTGSYDAGTYDTGSYATGSHATGTYGTGSYDTGSYDTGHWYPDQAQQQYAAPYSSYDTGSYDTTAVWASGGYGQGADIPAQATTQAAQQHNSQQHTGQWDTGQWDTGQWDTTQAASAASAYGTSYEAQATQTFEAPFLGTTAYDTGAYDATQWNSGGTAEQEAVHEQVPDQYSPADHPEVQAHAHDHDAHHPEPGPAAETDPGPEPAEPVGPVAADGETSHLPSGAPEFAPRGASRGRARRRTPAKRSALLTVAVPSVCVVGVAGIAAASVMSSGDDGRETQAAAAPDATAVKPSVANNKLDTQLQDLSADAGDFADRASRTQERIDLKAKQEADRKKAAEEAARKEAERPKFALPVKEHGLSAYYGQAGINWMSVHSGIDFPVSYGTPVMAATDGTVRTQWNSAYGNMAIVTAKDGTETWYCHLSAHTVMSGPVKAGDVIARSGNSGNSTGPHLHFEVRPGGGSAIDPLPWLRSHGLDPT
ncbi:M23 family metallopeptidase [Streptomyces sp. NPDC050400]|uniref:M23 family metallopeptidase n=1 Tax=Streptomyces sp. NPDC050400 TaxID=3365610 RepID=UPI0037AADF8A